MRQLGLNCPAPLTISCDTFRLRCAIALREFSSNHRIGREVGAGRALRRMLNFSDKNSAAREQTVACAEKRPLTRAGLRQSACSHRTTDRKEA